VTVSLELTEKVKTTSWPANEKSSVAISTVFEALSNLIALLICAVVNVELTSLSSTSLKVYLHAGFYTTGGRVSFKAAAPTWYFRVTNSGENERLVTVQLLNSTLIGILKL